jgi:hypothetical protein
VRQATARYRDVNVAVSQGFGVTWVHCTYDGPTPKAVRRAAACNKLPVDSITEVPVTLAPK